MELALIIVFIVADIVSQYYLIKHLDKKLETKEIPKTEEKPIKAELTEEEKEKIQKMKESFSNLMGFDYEKALKATKE